MNHPSGPYSRSSRSPNVITRVQLGDEQRSAGVQEGQEEMGVKVNEWAKSGACRNSDPDALFVQGAAQNRAKAVCLGCPVRTECLADALDHKIEFGVWGGMTERERRALLRRRPNVQSWRRLLEAAREEQLETYTAATAQVG